MKSNNGIASHNMAIIKLQNMSCKAWKRNLIDSWGDSINWLAPYMGKHGGSLKCSTELPYSSHSSWDQFRFSSVLVVSQLEPMNCGRRPSLCPSQTAQSSKITTLIWQKFATLTKVQTTLIWNSQDLENPYHINKWLDYKMWPCTILWGGPQPDTICMVSR